MKRTIKYLERIFHHSYRHERFRPPLQVITAGVSRWGPEDSFGRTKSATFSINYVTLGDILFEQNGRNYLVRQGEVFVPRRGSDHRFRTGPSGYAHKRFIQMEGPALDILLRLLDIDSQDHVLPHSPDRIAQLFRESYALMQSKTPGFTARLSEIGFSLLSELGRSSVKEYPSDLRLALDFIMQNLDKKLSLTEICEHAGLSMRHCNRLFQRHLHLSPVAFLNTQKMMWAENLLSNTKMGVKEVSRAVGFQDPFYFSTLYRKHFGLSPQQYREKRHLEQAKKKDPRK